MIAIIYEGAKTEKAIFSNIDKCFFKREETVLVEFIGSPFEGNIYALYKAFRESDGNVDIIELVRDRLGSSPKNPLINNSRDDFSEVYLFFDYDLQHSYNIEETSNIVTDMLNTFDNETEAGKLYISYPMVEALKDLKVVNICSEHCCVSVDSLTEYKSMVGTVHGFSQATKYDNDTWRHFCLHAVKKSNCIVKEQYRKPSFKRFINELTSTAIFNGQRYKFVRNGKVSVLSAIPLFLLEYFGNNKWNDLLSCSSKFKSKKSSICER